MQLTLNLQFSPAPRTKLFTRKDLWIDVSPEARMIGFTQKMEISQALSDALQPLRTEEEDSYNQRIYDAIWLAHHYWCLDQRPSFSFTFHFLQENHISGQISEKSLRLQVEVRNDQTQLGLLPDFPSVSGEC